MKKYRQEILNIELSKNLLDVRTIENWVDKMIIVNQCNIYFCDTVDELKSDYKSLLALPNVKEVSIGITAGV